MLICCGALKEYDVDDKEVSESNIIYLNDKAQELSSLKTSLPEKEKKDSSSSEGDFVDSLDVLHENTVLVKRSSNIDKFLMPAACPLSKSASYSGVSEKELLQNKIKELYKLYDNITNNKIEGIKPFDEQLTDSNTKITTDSEKALRAGKYNKKAAPVPPHVLTDDLHKDQRSNATSAIKATLILKPGVIKSVGPTLDESRPEFFASNSPKLKRKNPSKSKSPMSRLMMLPKKMAFWNKDESDAVDKDQKQSNMKRFSWNEMFSHSHKLKPGVSKMQSRSHEELSFEYLTVCDKNASPNINEVCFRARKLSASPTLCRKFEKEMSEKKSV